MTPAAIALFTAFTSLPTAPYPSIGKLIRLSSDSLCHSLTRSEEEVEETRIHTCVEDTLGTGSVVRAP